MLFKNILGSFLLLSCVFFHSAAFAAEEGTKQVLVVINRPVTQAEAAKGAIPATYDQLMAHVHNNDVVRQARLNIIREKLRPLDLAKEVFTIEYTEDARGGSVSDVIIRTSKGEERIAEALLPSLRDPERALPLEPGNAEARWNRLKDARAGGEAPAEVLKAAVLWILDASKESLRCEVGATGATFAETQTEKLITELALREKADLARNEVTVALNEVAGSLKRSQRLRLFEKKENRCLAPLLDGVWKQIVRDRRAQLAWDFKVFLEAVDANKKLMPFSGEIEAHVVPKGSELEAQLRYLQELVLELKSADLAGSLPATFGEWATLDTNTPSVESRMEPIDLLSFFVARDHFGPALKHTGHDAMTRISLAKAAIQHVLAPARYAPTIFVRKGNAELTKADGFESYFVSCSGEPISVSADSALFPKHDRLVDTLVFSASFLRELREKRGTFIFSCGAMTANLTNPIEPLHIPLTDPGSSSFVIGSDHKVKAVVSFQLIGAISADYLMKLKLGTLFQGYRGVDETPVTDLKKEFLDEMVDTDFYFPTNHGTDSATLSLGYEGGTKMRLRKVSGATTSEMVFFIPPAAGSARGVAISDLELAGLFKARRALADSRRLNVMNLRCGSVNCAPDWMRFYKLSLDDKMSESDARAKAKDLAAEVPIAIGAGRSFGTNTVQELIDHSRYPFKAIELATEEKPVSELITFLKEKGFDPRPSLGEPVFFSVDGQKDRVNVSIVTSTGVRIVY